MAAIFEFGVWTLVRDFTVYFSNVKGQLLKVELDINSEQRKCEDCRGRPLRAVDAAHEASSCSEIDSGLGAVCEMIEHVCISWFYSKYIKSVAHLFSMSRRAISIVTAHRGFIFTVYVLSPDIIF